MKFILWLLDLIKRFFLMPAPWTVKPMEETVTPAEPKPVEETPVEEPVIPQEPEQTIEPEQDITPVTTKTWGPPTPAGTSDEDAMVRVLYFEARGEPEKGILACANVILNRARILKRSIISVIDHYGQFTPRKRTDYWTRDISGSDAKLRALVKRAMAGENAVPSDYRYFSVGKARKYAMDFIRIGNHWFGRRRTIPVAHEDRLIAWGFAAMIDLKGLEYSLKAFQCAMGCKPDAVVGTRETGPALYGDIIVPRISEPETRCQCSAYYKGAGFCEGYPAGRGISMAVMVLAERIFRDAEKDSEIAGTDFFVSGVATDPSGKNGTWGGQIAGGQRCSKWNAKRGGATKSRHKLGIALDIWGRKEGVFQPKIRKVLETIALKLNVYGGVGYGATYIVHTDTDFTRSASSRRWMY